MVNFVDAVCRTVGSGAAWWRSPHQKAAGEREREKREGKNEKRGERKERGEKKERKGKESKRECVSFMGVNTPLELSKDYKRHEKRGGPEKKKKQQEERKKRQKRLEKTW